MTRASRKEAAHGASGGSLADMVAEAPRPALRESFPASTLAKAGVLLALLGGMNYRQFPYLVRKWIDDPNWTHGFLIPLFSLYLLYTRRAELLSARRKTCLLGLPVLLLACLLQVGAYWIENPWSCQVGMVLIGFALTLYLGGTEVIRLTWLPILFLLFALPIPDSKYQLVSLPLQNIAAKGGAFLLQVFGVGVRQTASMLWVQSVNRPEVSHPLTVAEACSGMRLLMAFVALSVAMAYLEERPIWQRVIMVAMGIPIAIFCNIIRVTITAVMFAIDHPEMGQGFMHDFTGMLMLIPAFVLLWLLGLLLGSLFIEVDEESDRGQPAEEVST